MKSAKIKEAQRSGRLTILFDSGIRTGSDIIKALALGAQAVLREFFDPLKRIRDLKLLRSWQAMAVWNDCRGTSRGRAGHSAYIG
jgi:hypothetical protein